MSPSPFDKEFARFAGELAESLSFNKSIGQIFGLLYLSDTPLSLDDIAQRLSMSKGNASINLRYLESWGAVKPVAISGTRRDHYEAHRNLKELALRRLQEGVIRRLDLAEERIASLSTSPDLAGAVDPHAKKRLQEMKALVLSGRKVMKVLPKFLSLLPK
jgi:DNA-binding transcriptional regulator GbsR (MarR family)